MAEVLRAREQPWAYLIYCIATACVPRASFLPGAPGDGHSGNPALLLLGRGAPTTVARHQLHLHNHQAEDGEKKKSVCVHARTCPCQVLGVPHACVCAALAMCTAGHVCQPAARRGCVCSAWAGCVFAQHMPSSAAAVFGSEKARAFDVCACWALQVFHARCASACVCVCARTCVCARV